MRPNSARGPSFLEEWRAVLTVYDLPMSRAARILASMIFRFLATFDPGAARGVVRCPGACAQMTLEPRRNEIPNRSIGKTTLFAP